MKKIPIANPVISDQGKASVKEVLDSGQLASGSQTDAFEDEFSDFVGTKHAIATANGTIALHAALVAAGIGSGDTVVTTPFSFVATANVIRLAGAEPIFADIDPETFNLDSDSVENLLAEFQGEIDAVMPVHLYGHPAEMGSFCELASEYGFKLIEDAAQAHSAEIRDQHVGTHGDVACFSFYPTKNMTTGEGGMIVTDDSEIAAAATRFVDHGRPPGGEKYEHATLGHNFKITDVEAALGRTQLTLLPKFVDKRQQNASSITKGINRTEAVPPTERSGKRHAYNQYTIRVGNRDKVQRKLSENGVGNKIYYPTLIPKLGAYDELELKTPVPTPVAEQVVDEVLSLPVHPSLDDDDLNRIKSSVREVPITPPRQF